MAERRITVGKEKLLIAAWSRRSGIPWTTIYMRLKRKWPPADAVSRPVGVTVVQAGRCPNQPDRENTHGKATVLVGGRFYCKACAKRKLRFLALIRDVRSELPSTEKQRRSA